MSFFVTALIVLVQTAVPPQQPVMSPAELTVQAGVLMSSGDIKKVARTPLILLNADFAARLLEVYAKGARNAGLQGRLYVASKRLVEMGGRPGADVVKQVQ